MNLFSGCYGTGEVLYKGKPTNYWVKQLKDKDVTTRVTAAKAIEAIGSEAKTAVPALIENLNDIDAEVRESAAMALGNVGSDENLVISNLLKALKNENYIAVRNAILVAIVKIGPAAVPSLITLLKEEDKNYRVSIINALGSIGPQASPAIPSLKAILNESDESIREAAKEALKEIQHN